MKQLFQRIFDCIEVIIHKIAFFFIWISNPILRHHISIKRVVLHDLKKSIDILLYGDKQASIIHRNETGHHLFNTEKDIWEGLCDWECARFTKPKKPLNARQTWIKFYNHIPCEHLLNKANL